jgi:hypothetical protein
MDEAMLVGNGERAVDSGEELVAECQRLLALATQAGLSVRPLGGTALVLQLGEGLRPEFRRPINDVDLVVRGRERDELAALLEENGYEPNQHFNAISARRRLLFLDERTQRHLDVFVDSLAMCHDIPLAERIDADPLTIPLAELLLTKLQIVELNERDYSDASALLYARELGDSDQGMINRERIAELCGRDWGLFHTVELSLERLLVWLGTARLGDEVRAKVSAQVSDLQAVLEAAPKSLRWKVRARVGERAAWFEDAEEVDRS